jgi:transcription antitermination protein NusB
MTSGPKSGGPKSGGSKGGAKSGGDKPVGGKTGSARTGGAKTGGDKSDIAKARAAKTGAAKTGRAQDGGHKGGHPKHNGHAKIQTKALAAPPGSPVLPRKANRRGAARLAAVQALYQMDMTGAGLNEILAQFESHWLGREVEGEQYLPAEAAFFRDIVSGVVDVQRDLDPRIDAALEATWPLKRIEAVLRSVLRAGAYELQKRTDIPARVVVSEYVDVAHAFVDKTETGMVNAVLDRLARNVRAAEFG